jgi:hypothetical protein
VTGACSNANDTDTVDDSKDNGAENSGESRPSDQKPASTGSIDSTPVAAEDFCTSLTLAHCEARQACCSDEARKYSGLTQCVQEYSAPCNLDFLIGQGESAAFDSEAAGIELARYRHSTAECGTPYELDSGALFEAGAFQEQCRGDADCPSGAVCDATLSSGYCVFADWQEGFSCTQSDECTPSLHCSAQRHPFFTDDDQDEDTPSTNDDEDPTTLDLAVPERVCTQGKRVKGSACIHGECTRGLHCSGSLPDGTSEYGWTKGKCAVPAKNGDYCFDGTECKSGLCDGTSFNDDWVYQNDSGMVTASPPTAGQCVACGPEDCGSSLCDEGVCKWGTPKRNKQDGASCDYADDCMSVWCASGICLTPEANDLYCPG